MASTFHGSDRRRSSLTILAIAAVLLVTGCGSSTASSNPPSTDPTVSPSPAPVTSPSPSASTSPADLAPIYDAIEAQVSDIRGLTATRAVDREFITRDELRTTLTEQFDEETPADYLAANERLYKALGLIPVDADLRTLSLDLLSGGVAAFYRSDEHKLYVVSSDGEAGASERFYFSHEYDHALQDENSTIFSDQEGVLDQSDRLLARQAVYEGDATLLMSQWAAANLTPGELFELLGEAADPAAQAAMDDTPPFMVETLTFPYTTGLGYVSSIQSAGGWKAVDAYFDRMPASTEQILHPEKYAAGEAPVDVALPADLASRLGTGWSVPLEDTFGEFQTGAWLREAGLDADTASDAAAGWGGDRLAVLAGPDGAWSVVMKTVWDTAADATAFEAAASSALGAADGVAQVFEGEGGKTRWVVVADDAPTAGQVEGVLGLAG
jgi:hypothetical protein